MIIRKATVADAEGIAKVHVSYSKFYEAMGAKVVDSTIINIAEDSLNLLVYGWEDIGLLKA